MSGLGWGAVAVLDSGALVMCACNSSSAFVTIGSASLPIPEPGRDIRGCFAQGHVYVAMKGQNTGRCLVVRDDGIVQTLGETAGNQCVGIIPWDSGVMAVYVMNTIQWVQDTLTADLSHWNEAILPLPASILGTSQGFLDLTAAGYPIWTDLNRTIKLPNGVELVLWLTRGNWTIGQGLVNPAQVSAYDGTTMYTVWEGDTSFPPQMGVSGSKVLAAIAANSATFVASPFSPYHVIPQPGPGPGPDPEPIPMPDATIMFRRADTTDPWQIGTIVPHTDGPPYVAIQVAAGYASLTPGGIWQAPAHSTGAWERFIASGPAIMAAPRQGGPGGVLTVANTQGKTQ